MYIFLLQTGESIRSSNWPTNLPIVQNLSSSKGGKKVGKLRAGKFSVIEAWWFCFCATSTIHLVYSKRISIERMNEEWKCLTFCVFDKENLGKFNLNRAHFSRSAKHSDYYLYPYITYAAINVSGMTWWAFARLWGSNGDDKTKGTRQTAKTRGKHPRIIGNFLKLK